MHVTPGPKFKGVTDESNTDMLYYNWVDQFDTLGLGRNVPFATGSYSDSLIAFAEEAVLTAVRTGWAPPVDFESPAAAVIRPVLVPTDDWRSCTVAKPGSSMPARSSIASASGRRPPAATSISPPHSAGATAS